MPKPPTSTLLMQTSLSFQIKLFLALFYPEQTKLTRLSPHISHVLPQRLVLMFHPRSIERSSDSSTFLTKTSETGKVLLIYCSLRNRNEMISPWSLFSFFMRSSQAIELTPPIHKIHQIIAPLHHTALKPEGGLFIFPARESRQSSITTISSI